MTDSLHTARLTRRQLIAAPSLALLPAAATSTFAQQATPEAISATLQIEPASVRMDEPFHVRVSGLTPGTEVTIRSSFIDGKARTFAAEATWEVGEEGVIDCSAMAPVSGDFDVADSMAFIWAARSAGDLYYVPSLFGATPVTFTARSGDEQFDAVTIERTMLPPDWPVEELSSPEMVGAFVPAITDGEGPAPGVIVIGGSEGGLGTSAVAAIFALHGYSVLALAYFGIDPLPETLTDIPLEYFGHAIEWLQERPEVDAERIAMVGFSRGAEGTLLVASHYPEIKAAISYAGSGLVYSTPGVYPPTPAWTWNGEPIPSTADQTVATLSRAEIEVERINGPVILIAGDADFLWSWSALEWPTTRVSRFAWDRLQAHNHPWPNQFLVYPGAGHAIAPPYNVMTFDRDAFQYPLGGSAPADQIASVNSWRAVLSTLAWRFGPGHDDLKPLATPVA